MQFEENYHVPDEKELSSWFGLLYRYSFTCDRIDCSKAKGESSTIRESLNFEPCNHDKTFQDSFWVTIYGPYKQTFNLTKRQTCIPGSLILLFTNIPRKSKRYTECPHIFGKAGGIYWMVHVQTVQIKFHLFNPTSEIDQKQK